MRWPSALAGAQGKNAGMEKYIVTLSAPEAEQLQALGAKGTHAAAKVINALILLNCDESQARGRRRSSQEIAEVLQVSARKIDRVKRRFVEEGLEVALSGAPSTRVYEHKVDGDLEAHLIALSCSTPPSGQARWSLRLLADQVVELQLVEAISHETVRRVLKKTNSSRGGRWAG
jgi:transposase